MIEKIQGLPREITGVRARGKVSQDDYREVIEPVIDEARKSGERMRFLYHFGPDFQGFTPSAAWEDLRIGLSNLRRFERCAVVSEIGWIRQSSRAMGIFMPCPVRVFGDEEMTDAIEWLTSPPEKATMIHRLMTESGVLVIELIGPLRSEHFDALALVVDPWIEERGALQGVVVHVRRFPGWEDLEGFFRHLRFIRDHHRQIERVAFVADGAMARLIPALSDHFVAADVKSFPYDDMERALEWASGGGRGDA